ncbi:MAG: hypothetical protein V4726_16585 [Verrucomicrobiota bacterium]
MTQAMDSNEFRQRVRGFIPHARDTTITTAAREVSTLYGWTGSRDLFLLNVVQWLRSNGC